MHRVLVLDPKRLEAIFNLGLFLTESGQLDEAIRQFEHALRLRPNMVAALFQLGNVFVKLGRLDEAVVCFRRALECEPSHTRAYVAIGTTLLRKGDRAEAQRYWSHGMKVAQNPQLISAAMRKASSSQTHIK